MQPEPEREIFTSTFLPELQRKGRGKKMARVCSQETRTETASVIGKKESTETIKESQSGAIHLLTVLSKMIAGP